MERRIRTPITATDGSLQINLDYDKNGWLLSTQNLSNQELKRVTIILYPKSPVFASKEKFRLGSIPALSYSEPQRFSLRINHPILSVNKLSPKLQQVTPEITITNQFRVDLLQTLNAHMNLDEIRTLCFHLSIEYENISGETRERKAGGLIDYCQRHLMIPQLLEACRFLNPGAPWPELPSPTKDPQQNDEPTSHEEIPSQVFKLGFKVVYRIVDVPEIKQFESELQLIFDPTPGK